MLSTSAPSRALGFGAAHAPFQGTGRRLNVLRWGLTLGALLTFARPVFAAEDDAATRSAARKIALDGIAALQRGDAEQATQKLEKAYRVLRVPSVALWSARALAKRGLLVEASERYQEALRLEPQQGEVAVQVQARKDAAVELEELTPRLPTLTLNVEGANGAEVKLILDGVVVPSALSGEERPVNPGEHRVVGVAGDEEVSQTLTLAEGQKQTITLSFTKQQGAVAAPGAPPAAQPKQAEAAGDSSGGTRRVLSYVALGVGGAGLVVGGITGVLVLRDKSDFEENPNCRNGECLQSEADEVNGFRTLRTVSTVGFIAGGALAATGIVLLLTSGSSAEPESARTALKFTLSPSSAALSGAF
jgi:tetratricopeptide (TPR) repeat protein